MRSRMKRALPGFILLIIIWVFAQISILYAQSPSKGRFYVEGETHLATEEGRVGIGTDTPEATLHIKGNENRDSYHMPGIEMLDAGYYPAGDINRYRYRMGMYRDHPISSPLGETTLRFWFPAASSSQTSERPGCGLFMQTDNNQDVRLYGDVYVEGASQGEIPPSATPPTPSRPNVRLGIGTYLSDMQATAPDGSTNGLIDAHDVYLRNVSSGLDNWASDHMMHKGKMERETSQRISDDRMTLLLPDSQVLDYNYGGITNPSSATQPNDAYFEITQKGIYLVTVSWRCPDFDDCDRANRDSSMEIRINVERDGQNQARFRAISFVKGPDGETGFLMGSDAFLLEPEDKVRIYVRHTAGGARDTLTEEGNRPRVSIVQVGPPLPEP